MRNKIPLGATVRDMVSGFTGKVLARSEALYEAPSVRIHPLNLDQNGNVIGSLWMEEGRLEVVEAPQKRLIGYRP